MALQFYTERVFGIRLLHQKCGVMASFAHRDSSAIDRMSAGEASLEPREVMLKHPGGRDPSTARPSGEKHHYSLVAARVV